MSQIIRVKRTKKGVETTLEDLKLNEPGPGVALIKHSLVPIEDCDIDSLQTADGPDSLGHTGIGVIEAAGKNDGGFSAGEIVTYYTPIPGSLATHRLVDTKYLTRLPRGLAPETIAASYFKGCMAHMLSVRTYGMHSQSTVLIHGAARASSLVLSQYCDTREPLRIIGVVENSEQIGNTSNGRYHDVVSMDGDWASQILKINKSGVNVCYDCIGDPVTSQSIQVCSFGSIIANYGNANGKNPSLSARELKSNSIYYTAPNIFQYKSNATEYYMTAIEIFEQIESRKIYIAHKGYDLASYKNALDAASKYPHYTPLITF